MSTRLAMFPLGTVLVPHGVLPLHVFEPRYRVLMFDCLRGTREFGVVLIEPGRIATPIWDRGIAAGDHLLARLGEAQKSVYAAQISAAQADAAGARAKGLPPEQAARVIVRALTGRNPRPRQLIGADARLAAAVTMLPFRLRYRLTAARR